MSLLLCGVVAVVALLLLLCFSVSLSLSLEQNGTLWHPGNKNNPNVLILVKDMEEHPTDYTADLYCLKSKNVCIWISNGWSFYRDYRYDGKARIDIGTMSLADRFLLWKALRKLRQTVSLDFELALRRKNGLIGKRG